MKISVKRHAYQPLTIELLFSMVIPEPNSGCWIWLNYVNRTGYGLVGYKGKKEYAHRAAWRVTHGDCNLTTEQHICHKCDVPCCVNPDHLFLGDRKANMEDMAQKSRHKPTPGERNYFAVLTDEQVIAIRKIPKSVFGKDIAKQYGMSEHAINRIRRNEGWRHLLTQTAPGVPADQDGRAGE